MLFFKNKKLAFNPQRCTQCGACLAACPNGSLKNAFTSATGLNAMYADESCTRCGKCVSVCPAHHLPRQIKAQDIFPARMEAFLSRNKSDAVAYSSSSGGAARTIAKACLDSRLVGQVYMVLADDKYPWAKGCLISDGDEAMRATTSMYLPVMGAKELEQASGGESILVVGLPCQVLAAQKLLRDKYKKIYTLSIFCKQQKTLGATRHYCKRVGCEFTFDGPPMQFRGTGWPGVVRRGEHELLHIKFCVLPFGFPLWRVPGCNMCNMPFGNETDISIADPWGIDDEKDTFNTPGNSLVMIMTDDGRKMFSAGASSLVSTEIEDINIVRRSVDLAGIVRKHDLAQAHAGKKAPILIRLARIAEIIQSRILEQFLLHIKLTEKLYWACGKQPQLAKLIYRAAKFFEKKS